MIPNSKYIQILINWHSWLNIELGHLVQLDRVSMETQPTRPIYLSNVVSTFNIIQLSSRLNNIDNIKDHKWKPSQLVISIYQAATFNSLFQHWTFNLGWYWQHLKTTNGKPSHSSFLSIKQFWATFISLFQCLISNGSNDVFLLAQSSHIKYFRAIFIHVCCIIHIDAWKMFFHKIVNS